MNTSDREESDDQPRFEYQQRLFQHRPQQHREHFRPPPAQPPMTPLIRGRLERAKMYTRAFFPRDGICYSCKQQIFALVDPDDDRSSHCPYCNHAFNE